MSATERGAPPAPRADGPAPPFAEHAAGLRPEDTVTALRDVVGLRSFGLDVSDTQDMVTRAWGRVPRRWPLGHEPARS
ncbi:hypothetical protein [Streptomyces sp. MBT60]|uniref:hypothetical protein n=1 Tax=Streptomyces sp. MBT60 TaxID=2800409 RepID=UPI00190ADD92|nr:hypothetical protein [Streptomyces sp. MBT60]MBK3547634.1 hypothetical protein [Streptomyces sp. MBT60]